MIGLLYFAWVRERIGKDGEQIALPVGVASVSALLDWLATRGDEVFADRNRLRVAVNQVFAGPEAPIAEGDEIAIFPPVTGG